MVHNLTDENFWNSYWESIDLPSEINLNFEFDRCLSSELVKSLKDLPSSAKVLEIGAAPGRWLAFLAKRFDFKVSAIEYSSNGVKVLKKNLDMLNVNLEQVLEGDFFSLKAQPIFDVVMSFGFIEHFNEVDKVINHHSQWLKSGGKLIVGIPNFSNFHGRLQKILDPEVYNAHNISIMSPNAITQLDLDENLSLQSSIYISSFQPSLPYWTRKSECNISYELKIFPIRVLLFALSKIRKFRFWDYFNNRFVSGYIYTTYVKN